MTDYPMHDKLKPVAHISAKIGEFTDWLATEKHIYLAKRDFEGDLYVEHHSIADLMAEFFDIDLKVLEGEKRHMLRTIREAAEEGST